jgi:hypothetical protein
VRQLFPGTGSLRTWARVHFFRFWTWLLVVGLLIWAVVENRPDLVIGWLDANLWAMKQISLLVPSVGPWLEVGLRASGFDRLVFATFDIVLLRIALSAIAAAWRMGRPRSLRTRESLEINANDRRIDA